MPYKVCWIEEQAIKEQIFRDMNSAHVFKTNLDRSNKNSVLYVTSEQPQDHLLITEERKPPKDERKKKKKERAAAD